MNNGRCEKKVSEGDNLIRFGDPHKMRWMRLLAVDTTSRAGSIALLEAEELRGLVSFSTLSGHAGSLLPTVDRFLRGLSITLQEIEVFAVATGPGSFTGIRIGIATVEGLAFATGRPVVAVSALEATAHRYRFRQGLLASFLDARRGEVFAALYHSDGNRLEPVGEPVCSDPERFLGRLPPEPVLVAGSGIVTYKELLSRRRENGVRTADPSFFLAEEVARIGRGLHQEGKDLPLGGIEAVYMRLSDAEKAREAAGGAVE